MSDIPQGGMRALFRRARGLLGGRAVILMYHRIADEAWDPYGLCVSPVHFAQHLEVIRRAGRPMALSELAADVRRGSVPAGAVCVTFDDGYTDNLEAAAPLLRRHDVPATCFITTGRMGRDREFWWDELEQVLLGAARLPTRLRLEANGHEAVFETGDEAAADERPKARGWTFQHAAAPTARHALLRDVHGFVQPLPDAERERVLAELRAQAAFEPVVRASHRALEPDGVAALERSAPIEIGAHTVGHPHLPGQTEEVQRLEVAASRRTLEEWVGHAVDGFAYPYGAYSDVSVAAVRDAGFTHACSGLWGGVRLDSDVLLLPRVEAPNAAGDAFEALLRKYLRR